MTSRLQPVTSKATNSSIDSELACQCDGSAKSKRSKVTNFLIKCQCTKGSMVVVLV